MKTTKRRPVWVGMTFLGLCAMGLVGDLLAEQEPFLESDLHEVEVVLDRARTLSFAQDPADSLYRSARQAMNAGDFDRAAGIFSQLRSDYPSSDYAADAYYFEAFSRFRVGSRGELARAEELLAEQRRRFPDASTAEDARELLIRIDGQRARSGDGRALMNVASQAAQPCEDEDQDVKAMAVSALMNMDADRARPILMEVLRSDDECSTELKRTAIWVLAEHGGDDPSIVELMTNLILDPDTDQELQQAASFALSQSDSPAALDALLRILSTSQDSEVLQHIVSSLAHGSDRHQQAIMEYARRDDADPEARRVALFMLGMEGTNGAFDFLVDMWGVGDEELKEAVISAMGQSSDPRAGDWLIALARDRNASSEDRRNALFWFTQHGGRTDVDQLVSLYREFEDGEAKEAVLFALSHHAGGGDAVTALMDIARSEEDPELKSQAIFWLGQSDDPRVPEFLLEILRR